VENNWTELDVLLRYKVNERNLEFLPEREPTHEDFISCNGKQLKRDFKFALCRAWARYQSLS
jgi:hypothetical protein